MRFRQFSHFFQHHINPASTPPPRTTLLQHFANRQFKKSIFSETHAMATVTETNVGAIIILTPPKEGRIIWEAKQQEVAPSLPPGDIESRKPIDWSFGPIKVAGYVETGTLETTTSISIVGISLGNVHGNLKDGVGVSIDLFAAKGSLKFYLKNGKEFWTQLDVKITFDGSYSGDYKITDI